MSLYMLQICLKALDGIFSSKVSFSNFHRTLKFNEITPEQKGVKGGKSGRIKDLLQPKQVLFLVPFNI